MNENKNLLSSAYTSTHRQLQLGSATEIVATTKTRFKIKLFTLSPEGEKLKTI